MSKLTESINTFVTGDLVFTRYPPTSPQPIHVTVFLAPRVGLGQSFVHAGALHLEIAPAASYADDKDSGGYLHAHPTDDAVRARTAAVAEGFARTIPRTAYGSYPSSKDFARLGLTVTSPHASRFTGMVRTTSFAEIPFDFPALVRLLKWTLRAIEGTPLSENRGITCAAFVSICQQVARMLIHFDDLGLTYQPQKIRTCLQTLEALVQTKASLRKNLEKIGEDPARGGKAIYRDQAYRENSNKNLTDQGKGELGKLNKDVQYANLPTGTLDRLKKRAESSEIERYWMLVQTQMLDVHEASTVALQDMLGPFFFDAKYVSSPILAQKIRASGWATTAFTAY